MNALAALDRSRIAHNVAALRSAGWPAGRALTLVASGLAAGAPRTRLEEIAASLSRGVTPAEDADPLQRMLARGDAAGADALRESARAFEVDEISRRTAIAGMLYPIVVLSFCAVISAMGAFVVPAFDGFLKDFGSALPMPTIVVLRAAPVLAWLPLLPAIAGVCAIVMWNRVARALPGARELRAAAALHAFSAALRSGVAPDAAIRWAGGQREATIDEVAEIPLDARERALLRRWTETSDPATAAAAIAITLEVSGRRRAFLGFRIVPVVASAGAAAVVGAIVIALYLPLFTIANVL